MRLIKVKYHMGIECLTGGWHETPSFEGDTVGELILHLIDKHPALKDCFIDKREMEPAPGISILVNGREIMWLRGMATPLSEGDEIDLLRFVSGG